jgi:hypothetical protein
MHDKVRIAYVIPFKLNYSFCILVPISLICFLISTAGLCVRDNVKETIVITISKPILSMRPRWDLVNILLVIITVLH